VKHLLVARVEPLLSVQSSSETGRAMAARRAHTDWSCGSGTKLVTQYFELAFKIACIFGGGGGVRVFVSVCPRARASARSRELQKWGHSTCIGELVGLWVG
jgi:hypothetical protein